MATFTIVDQGAWASVAAGASPAADLLVPYPAAANGTTVPAEDRLYLLLHSKPDTGTIAPSGSWTFVGQATGGGGSVGASTGPTKFDVYRRDHPGTALTSTTSVNTSAVGTGGVVSGKIIQCRPSTPGTPTWSEALVSFSRTSVTSSLAFSSSAGITIADDDHVIVGILSPDDGLAGDESLTAVTQTGTTFSTPVELGAKENTTLANDLASDLWDVEATAGSGSGVISNVGTSAASETRLFTWLRIRLTQAGGGTTTGALAGTAPAATGALAATETDTASLAGAAPRATGAVAAAQVDPGALAGRVAQSTGAMAATQRTTALLAGTAPSAVGATQAGQLTAGPLAGTVAQSVGGLVGGQGGVGALAGQAPRATGALLAQLVSTAVTGALAGSAPTAVGTLRQQVNPVGGPFHAGTPVLAPGLRSAQPVLVGDLAAGPPEVR